MDWELFEKEQAEELKEMFAVEEIGKKRAKEIAKEIVKHLKEQKISIRHAKAALSYAEKEIEAQELK